MNHQQIKEAIADAFQKHFNHFGFKKTSVDDISNELHLSKKTIYQNFSTKEEIFYYVVSRVAREYVRGMEREIAGSVTAAGKLAALVRLIFSESKQWLKDNDVFEFRYKQEIGELAFKDAYSGLLFSLVKQGMESGEFSTGQPEFTVRLIQGMISEAMHVVAANPSVEVEEQLIQSILKILR
ncbi:MAG: TetR/AcrR family transcriptional regulator [Anaerolineaceae bacterium]|nr:TetR/AcrR family transcriptional regulator [Anaerolineaceae bacterium]